MTQQNNTQSPNASPSAAHIRNVFSTQEIRKVGTGATSRKTVYKAFYFIEQKEDGSLECRPLNSNYVPSGQKRGLNMEELLEKFSMEPEFYTSSVLPKVQELVSPGHEQATKFIGWLAEKKLIPADMSARVAADLNPPAPEEKTPPAATS